PVPYPTLFRSCPVGGRADLVVWLRVRSKLAAPLRASPLLGRRDQRPADTTAAGLGHNEPSLKVGHPIAAAALGVRSNRQFGKSDGASCPVLGEQDGERLPQVAGKEPLNLLTVLAF